MKTLHLNLKKKWFNMILSGEKKEEYRELTNYWLKRFFDVYITDAETGKKETKSGTYSTLSQNSWLLISEILESNEFDTITFSNGYAKDRPQFEIELKEIFISYGVTHWGAIPNKNYFVLKLGKIIN